MKAWIVARDDQIMSYQTVSHRVSSSSDDVQTKYARYGDVERQDRNDFCARGLGQLGLAQPGSNDGTKADADSSTTTAALLSSSAVLISPFRILPPQLPLER